MTSGLYQSGAALGIRMRQLDSIARNLANVGTAGYKRGATSANQFSIDGRHGRVTGLTTTTTTDFSQGDLNRTGHPLDLALQGEGFFAVEGRAGEAYTRDGAFRMTVDGEIVTAEGYSVAWANRSGKADPTGFPLEIDGDGTVRQADTTIGTLRIVNFEDPTRLEQRGGGMWTAPTSLKEATATAVVHQGALEGSNAAAMNEMIAMIEVQRSFESIARMMSSIEQSYRRLTRPF